MNLNELRANVVSGLNEMGPDAISKHLFFLMDSMNMSKDGVLIPSMTKYHDTFVSDINVKVPALVDQMIENVLASEYFMTLFNAVGNKKLEALADKYYGNKVTLAQISLIAYCLEFCAQILTTDKSVAKEHLDKAIKSGCFGAKNLFKVLIRERSLFIPVKMFSVFVPAFSHLYDGKFKTINVTKDRFLFQANILEAVLEDLAEGFPANAIVGLVSILTTYPLFQTSGTVDSQYKTTIVEPNIDKWVELYITWNYTFISSMKAAPATSVKLLIPSVLAKKNAPHFLSNRMYTLFLYLNMIGNKNYYEYRKQFKFKEKEFRSTIGLANLKNAASFLLDRKVRL